MMKKIICATLALSFLAWLGARTSRAADAPSADAAGGDKVFEADKGPDSIDVSKYPKAQQDNYAVFSQKCSKCHTLARPINSKLALPEEWTNYVNLMRSKKRSGIDEKSAKTIIDFLTYDSSVRKKDLLKKKQQEKAAAEAAGG
jgi:hypothetical protein